MGTYFPPTQRLLEPLRAAGRVASHQGQADLDPQGSLITSRVLSIRRPQAKRHWYMPGAAFSTKVCSPVQAPTSFNGYEG